MRTEPGTGRAAIDGTVATDTVRVNEISPEAGTDSYQPATYDHEVTGEPTPKNLIGLYIGQRLKEEYQDGQSEDPPLSWERLAERYGMKKPTVKDLAEYGLGAGQLTEARYAAVHFGKSVDELRRAAAKWWSEHGQTMPDNAVPLWRSRPIRWPRMLPALEMALDAGYEPAFLEAFSSEVSGGEEETDAATWWLRIQLAYRSRERVSDSARTAAELAPELNRKRRTTVRRSKPASKGRDR